MTNSSKIDQVNSTKFLGVTIDATLSFHEHIISIKSKIARGIGILYKCKNILNRNALVTLYYSFIYPYLTYCMCIWGRSIKTYLEPLFKMQKKIVRLICKMPYDSHSLPLFRDLGRFSLYDIYVYSVFLFKFNHKLLLKVFEDFYIVNETIHPHNTRQLNQFHVPMYKGRLGNNTIRSTRCLSIIIYAML